MSDFTEKVRAMLDAATPGPWEADTKYPHDCVVWGPGDDEFLANVDHIGPITPVLSGEEHVKMQLAYDIDIANAKLIASAPTILREACERIERLELLKEECEFALDIADAEVSTSTPEAWEDLLHMGERQYEKLREIISALDAKE